MNHGVIRQNVLARMEQANRDLTTASLPALDALDIEVTNRVAPGRGRRVVVDDADADSIIGVGLQVKERVVVLKRRGREG